MSDDETQDETDDPTPPVEHVPVSAVVDAIRAGDVDALPSWLHQAAIKECMSVTIAGNLVITSALGSREVARPGDHLGQRSPGWPTIVRGGAA